MDVAIASERRAGLIRGSLPSLSSKPALCDTPTRVPRVSKISTKRNANNTAKKSREPIFEKSIFINTGAMLCGRKEARPWNCGKVENAPTDGSGIYKPVASAIIPRIHVDRIPQRILPRIFLIIKNAVRNIPRTAITTGVPVV